MGQIRRNYTWQKKPVSEAQQEAYDRLLATHAPPQGIPSICFTLSLSGLVVSGLSQLGGP